MKVVTLFILCSTLASGTIGSLFGDLLGRSDLVATPSPSHASNLGHPVWKRQDGDSPMSSAAPETEWLDAWKRQDDDPPVSAPAPETDWLEPWKRGDDSPDWIPPFDASKDKAKRHERGPARL